MPRDLLRARVAHGRRHHVVPARVLKNSGYEQSCRMRPHFIQAKEVPRGKFSPGFRLNDHQFPGVKAKIGPGGGLRSGRDERSIHVRE